MAIPTKIKQLANDVRTKIYGIDVRESIAKGMEVSGEISEESNKLSKDTAGRQDHIETRYDVAVGAHTEDSEVLDARIGVDGVTHTNVKKRLDTEQDKVITKLEYTSNDVEQKGLNINNFKRIIPEVSDSGRINRAIESIKTDEFTEIKPGQGPLNYIYLPAGRYKISESIKLPSYMRMVGAGRHTTFLDSEITNGTPVIHVYNEDHDETEQFYNTIENITIDGQYNDCQGIFMDNTIRWVLDKVIVMRTKKQALNIYNSYLGDAYSFYAQTCGDKNHPTVSIDGKDISYGGNSVRFFGGELHGHIDYTSNGVELKYGYSTSFIGTTIEGYGAGAGIVNENGISTMVHGVYFEKNKEHIVETGEVFGANYTGNMFGPLSTGTRGHIGINHTQSAKIEGNFFFTPTSKKIFDSSPDGVSGRMLFTSVKNNSAPEYPIKIDQSLIDSGRYTGTVIESFDGSFSNMIQGRQKYSDRVDFEKAIRANEGIYDIGIGGVPGDSNSPRIIAGNGSPNNNIASPAGTIYLRKDDLHGPTLYTKKTGSSTIGWIPSMNLDSGTRSQRPTVIQVGYQYFDTTLQKPVWYNGSGWVDSNGQIV